jgi:hypothetical protein
MSKLTTQDKIKKMQTNIKSAQSIFVLSGILALIYVVRYFVTGNFNFYFSSYITEFALKAADENIASAVTLSGGASYALLAVYAVLFIVCCVLCLKSKLGLWACLTLHLTDYAALLVGTALSVFGSFREEIFIDIIVHFFVLLFIVVGIYSTYKLPKLESEKE